MQALIFANGDLSPETDIPDPAKYELIIAANGGSDHCLRLDIQPDVLIGDLDSISQLTLEKWSQAGVEINQHPRRKDKTDLEIALEVAHQRGAREIHVYGALGDRLDMTLANVYLLAHPSLPANVKLIRKQEVVSVLRAQETITLHGQPGDRVSLLPLDPRTRGITTEHLEYPLQEETLEFGTSRGISNIMKGETATISLQEGILCIVHTGLKN